jgi:hypothetical protein
MRVSSGALCALVALSSWAVQSVDGFVTSHAHKPTVGVGNSMATSSPPLKMVSRLDNEQKVATENDDENDDDETKSPSENPLYPRSRVPNRLRVSGRGIPGRKEKVQLVDTTTYEASLLQRWEEDPVKYQRGFDWEIEKARRYFAGLRMREDGAWVKQPSLFEFLVSTHRTQSAALAGAPAPVNILDVAWLFGANILSSLGLGPALGMAAVPNAVIQKYEGSFLTFMKGVLGGDLQTLAGGPLFLLLNKYFLEYGPIFNLSFGPKSFLVISDPVMARHILRTATPEQYCKGMLAEILEPIMGKGLIPADPATWRVSCCRNTTGPRSDLHNHFRRIRNSSLFRFTWS